MLHGVEVLIAPAALKHQLVADLGAIPASLCRCCTRDGERAEMPAPSVLLRNVVRRCRVDLVVPQSVLGGLVASGWNRMSCVHGVWHAVDYCSGHP